MPCIHVDWSHRLYRLEFLVTGAFLKKRVFSYPVVH